MNQSTASVFLKRLAAAAIMAPLAYTLLLKMSSFVISNGYWSYSLFLQHGPVLLMLAILLPVYIRFVGPLPLGNLKSSGAHWHVLALIALYLGEWAFEKLTGAPQEPFMATIFAKPLPGIISTCLVIFLIAPLNEEIIFRGMILNVFTLGGRGLFWLGACVSSVLFMLVHSQYQQTSTLIEMFAVGMILCSARRHSGGMVLPVMLHILASVIAVILG